MKTLLVSLLVISMAVFLYQYFEYSPASTVQETTDVADPPVKTITLPIKTKTIQQQASSSPASIVAPSLDKEIVAAEDRQKDFDQLSSQTAPVIWDHWQSLLRDKSETTLETKLLAEKLRKENGKWFYQEAKLLLNDTTSLLQY